MSASEAGAGGVLGRRSHHGARAPRGACGRAELGRDAGTRRSARPRDKAAWARGGAGRGWKGRG